MLSLVIPFFIALFVLVTVLFLTAMFFSQKNGSGVIVDVYMQESFCFIQTVYVVKIHNDDDNENCEYTINKSICPEIEKKKGEEIIFKFICGRITHVYEKNEKKEKDDSPESMLEAAPA